MFTLIPVGKLGNLQHQYYIFQGIRQDELRSELLSGMRLPSPMLSSPNISHLMQSCWLADPTERPSFLRIEQVLFHELQQERENVDNNSQYYLSLLELNEGRNQYKSIKECNLKCQTEKENIIRHEKEDE